MQNKARTRTDVQWVISSVSLAVTLGLWGLFTGHEKGTAGVAGQVEMPAALQEQVIVPQPQTLAPGQVLLFGGTAPQPQQPQIVVSQPRHKGGGGGGGGGAVTSTGSSRP
jgi:hypothetical protein